MAIKPMRLDYNVILDLERLAADSAAMDIIARTLSGSEWTSEMFDAIADLIRSTGRTIADYRQ